MGEPRGYLLGKRGWFPLDGRLHRAWRHWSDTILPLWPWRPLCWLNGEHEDYYGSCVICRRPLAPPPTAERADRRDDPTPERPGEVRDAPVTDAGTVPVEPNYYQGDTRYDRWNDELNRLNERTYAND